MKNGFKGIDRVYGEFTVNEPVTLALLNSNAMQRLKRIDSASFRPLWVKPETEMGEFDNSRYAHSVGVYLLLRKYGASIEERIAGLIHDVSHTAFSHCADYIFAEGSGKEQNHQDNVFDSFARKTEIPEILKKYACLRRQGFELKFILNDKNFPLKENKLPDLCADRIDYSLRTAVIFNELNAEDLDFILRNLTAENRRWIFNDFFSARKFAELFFRLNKFYYSGFRSAVMFRATGDCIGYALKKKYVSESDLYSTDGEVIEKVKAFVEKDARLKIFWERMNGRVAVENDPIDCEAEVFIKSRVVDPQFKENNEVKLFSDAAPEWKEILRNELSPKAYYLKFGAVKI